MLWKVNIAEIKHLKESQQRENAEVVEAQSSLILSTKREERSKYISTC